MKLNPFAPSDNPLYESLFCFGGGGDSGDSGGGGSNASGDPSEESTVDFSGGPGFDDGDTGDTGGSSNVGGSSDDQDSMDSGYDTSTVGMGTNTMGGGGDGGAGPAAGPSLIDSYLDGPMLADISTPMVGGAFVDPMTGRGVMADIPSVDYGSLAGLDPSNAGQDQGSLLGQIAPGSAGGEKFDYTPDDIFGDLTPEQLMVQEYVSGLKAGTPASDIVSQARSSALAPTPVEKQKPVGIETIKSPMDTPQSTQQERAAAAAAIASGVLTPSDIQNKVAGGSGFSTRPGDKAGESVLSIDGKEYTFDNTLPGNQRTYSPVQAAGVTAARDVTPGAQQLSPEAQAVVDESNRMGDLLSQARTGAAGIQQTLGGIQGTIQGQRMGAYDPTEPEGGAIGVQSLIDEAKANTQQNISSGSPTPSTVNTAAMEDAIPGTTKSQPSNIDPETGLPVSVRQANAPTFGEVPNYDETDYLDIGSPGKLGPYQNQGQDLVSARKAAVEAGLAKAAEESPINTGIGIVDNIYNSIMAPNTTAKNMVMEDGAYVAYDMTPEQNVIGAINTQTGSIQPTSGNFFNTELNPYYDQYGRGPEGGDDGDQTTMPEEVAPVAPQTCPDGYTYDAASDSCVYQGRSMVSRAQYQPQSQPQYAYTGLPSLAPTALRPSFQARGNYGPLYNFR
jgi:hypothetical protein